MARPYQLTRSKHPSQARSQHPFLLFRIQIRIGQLRELSSRWRGKVLRQVIVRRLLAIEITVGITKEHWRLHMDMFQLAE